MAKAKTVKVIEDNRGFTVATFAAALWDAVKLDTLIIEHVRSLGATDELRAAHKVTYVARRIALPGESRASAEKRAAEIIADKNRDALYNDILAGERNKWKYWLDKANGAPKKGANKGGDKATAKGAQDKPATAPAPVAETSPKVKTRDGATLWAATKAAALLTFANKNGDVLDPRIGEAIKALDRAIATVKAEAK